MRRSQAKLVAAISALVVVLLGGLALQLDRDLVGLEEARSRADLEARAVRGRELLGDLPLDTTPREALNHRAREVAEALGGRVTLIRNDGVVVADSALPPAQIARMENHGSRPEVVAAHATGLGHDVRTSTSVGRPLRYVAVPLDRGDGVVRLADAVGGRPAAEIASRRLMQSLVLGLVGALVVAFVFSRAQARSLERMRQVADSLVGGDLSQRVRRHSGDEFDPIARAIDRIAEQLRLRLDEATQEKERLQAVLNAMVEGVLVVDTGGKIVLLNDRARAFFDVAGAVNGRSFLEVMRHADLDALLSHARETDAPVSREIRLPDPEERTLQAHAVRFPSGSAARMGTVAVFHDVTELERLEQVRRDFVANASHELRTPLAAISGFAETLLGSRTLSEQDRQSYLEIIDRHAQRLTRLVNDLLELSKIESHKVDLEAKPVDVVALAERLLEDYHERFAEKDLLASVERRGRPRARGDERAVEQILVNLVDNAVKYTEPGGTIVIRIEAEADEVGVAVEDTGIGIPAGDRERIFERFYRVDKARSRELGGTGLGLSIVKHLVQNQGGEITVESAVGEGTRFRFTLPREPEAA